MIVGAIRQFVGRQARLTGRSFPTKQARLHFACEGGGTKQTGAIRPLDRSTAGLTLSLFTERWPSDYGNTPTAAVGDKFGDELVVRIETQAASDRDPWRMSAILSTEIPFEWWQ